MNLDFLGISSVIEGVGKVADDLITSDEERLKIALEEKKLDQALLQGQLEINKVEAQHQSIFVAGWRPMIGWIGAAALSYQFLIYPFYTWIWSHDHPGTSLDLCPGKLDADLLWALISGMLGIAGMRSFDKLKGTQTRQVGNNSH